MTNCRRKSTSCAEPILMMISSSSSSSFWISLLLLMLLATHPASVVGNLGGSIRRGQQQPSLQQPSYTFPVLVTVNTTRDIASQYSAIWDIQKKGSRRLDEANNVQLNLMVYNEEEFHQLDQLHSEGALQYDKKQQQQDNNHHHRNLKGGNNDFFSFGCYRSVDETFAIMNALAELYPDFVTVQSIGQSWWKQQNLGGMGHDIKVMVLSSSTGTTSKDGDMMLVGGHHSRELPPPEVVLRWAQHLLENYGEDADITWILDRTKIHIVPIANPDGREIVQNNPTWSYRKNAHPHGCQRGVQDDGVDLNRNYKMWYGQSYGSSNNPCAVNFRGNGALSEPEAAAIYQYASTLFAPATKKRGKTVDQALARAQEACPEDSSGLFIDIHSFGNFVYFPWGHNDVKSPNHQSLLTMASKLAKPGDYTLWGPGQDGFLYFVSGDATDSTYGLDCVASFGYEVGSNAFHPSCSELEGEIVPIMTTSLLYAAKTVLAPYRIPLGPDIINIQVDRSNPARTQLTVKASDEALIVSHAKFDGQKSQPIAAIRVWVDTHPYDAPNGGVLMTPQDGRYDNVEEVATYTLNTANSRVFYFRATDNQGYEGPVSAVFAKTGIANSQPGSTGSTTSSCFLDTLKTLWTWWEDYDISNFFGSN